MALHPLEIWAARAHDYYRDVAALRDLWPLLGTSSRRRRENANRLYLSFYKNLEAACARPPA